MSALPRSNSASHSNDAMCQKQISQRRKRSAFSAAMSTGVAGSFRWPNSECMVPCTYRDDISVPHLGGHVVRLSSSFIAPSTVAVLSTALLCGPAASQIATDSAKPLPRITVEAPKQVARPNSPKQVANTVASRRRSTTQTSSSTVRTPSPAPDSILGRIAKLEKVASNCNGGCESSLPHGKDPWVGCSESGGGFTTGPFSATCRDNLNYKSYVDCVETKWFLGEYRNRAWWLCSSLQAAGKLQVAELKRSRQPH
jgi:hypothetical protein